MGPSPVTQGPIGTFMTAHGIPGTLGIRKFTATSIPLYFFWQKHNCQTGMKCELLLLLLWNLESWINVFKILNGIFYKNNEFLLTKSNHLQWSTQFLKFTVRILPKLPRDQNNLEQVNNNKLQFIKNQINFINNVLLSFFSQRQVISERGFMD